MILGFLEADPDCFYADSYLLATVFWYFLEANLSLDDYQPHNFFTAL